MYQVIKKVGLGAALLLATLSLTGCLSAKSYVDMRNAVTVKQLKQPDIVAPAQVVVEFRSNGKPNAGATKYVKPIVMKYLAQSTLFAELSETPSPNKQVLTVVIDNLADMGEAATKGFGTGLTLGLVGTSVEDRYVASLVWVNAAGARFEGNAKDSIVTTIGNTAGPADLQGMDLTAATDVVFGHLVNAALKNITDQAGFH